MALPKTGAGSMNPTGDRDDEGMCGGAGSGGEVYIFRYFVW